MSDRHFSGATCAALVARALISCDMRVPAVRLRHAVLVTVVALQLAAIAYIRSENQKTLAMQETIARTQRTLGAMANVLTELNREHEGALASAVVQRTQRQQQQAGDDEEKKKSYGRTAEIGTIPADVAVRREAEGRLVVAQEQLRARGNEVCSHDDDDAIIVFVVHGGMYVRPAAASNPADGGPC